MSQIISFDFSSNAVRVLTINNFPWFVAVDICKVLDISNSRDALKSLDDDEKDVINAESLLNVANTDGQKRGRGGAQKYNIVNESGLYALIFKSRKPIAKKFRKWVTNEVLPSIRQTGQYHTDIKPDQYAEEYISDAQYQELRHVVWLIENNFRFKRSGSHAAYRVLRKELRVESVTKLPARLFDVAMARLNEIKKQAEAFSGQVNKIEREFYKNDFKTADLAQVEQYAKQLSLY